MVSDQMQKLYMWPEKDLVTPAAGKVDGRKLGS